MSPLHVQHGYENIHHAVISADRHDVMSTDRHAAMSVNPHAVMSADRHAVMSADRHDVMSADRHAVMSADRHAVMSADRYAIFPSDRHTVVSVEPHVVMSADRYAVMPSDRHTVVSADQLAVMSADRYAVMPSDRHTVVSADRLAVMSPHFEHQHRHAAMSPRYEQFSSPAASNGPEQPAQGAAHYALVPVYPEQQHVYHHDRPAVHHNEATVYAPRHPALSPHHHQGSTASSGRHLAMSPIHLELENLRRAGVRRLPVSASTAQPPRRSPAVGLTERHSFAQPQPVLAASQQSSALRQGTRPAARSDYSGGDFRGQGNRHQPYPPRSHSSPPPRGAHWPHGQHDASAGSRWNPFLSQPRRQASADPGRGLEGWTSRPLSSGATRAPLSGNWERGISSRPEGRRIEPTPRQEQRSSTSAASSKARTANPLIYVVLGAFMWTRIHIMGGLLDPDPPRGCGSGSKM